MVVVIKKISAILNVLPLQKLENKCMSFLRQEANIQANKTL